ncbi:MAG TPA: biotin/lipoyl-containing protein [bacterium]|nr:biotin/lipoyl-containing protein [bacterium]
MYEFKLPSLGADMQDAKLVEWKVKAGDRVTKGDIIATIETRKSAVDIEIFRSGVVDKILVQPGEEWLPVGKTLALILEDA